MTGYLVNFSIYTLAMVGVIFAALFIFKSVMNGNRFSKKSSFLQIEDTMSLSPRKTLYVVRAGNKKFLLAGDVDRTALIARLEDEKAKTKEEICSETISELYRQDKSSELNSMDGIESMDEFASIIDFNFRKNQDAKNEKFDIGKIGRTDGNISRESFTGKPPMMKELARKLSSL